MNEIGDLFSFFGPWTWWLIAGVLAVLELVVPGVFFIWLAAAAAAVGILVQIVDIGWELQVAAFAAFSVVSLGVSRVYIKRSEQPTDHPTLNQRGLSYVGRVFVLEEPIVNGRGKVRIGDTLWRAEGPDLPVGTNVRVTSVDGVVLLVEPMS